MAITRRRLVRRKYVRRRRSMLKAVRPYRKITNQVHRYLRWAQSNAYFPDSTVGPNLILSKNTNQHFSYSFNLRNVVNSVDFQSLYDMYKINKVTIYLERLQTQNIMQNSSFNKFVRCVHDYNDNNILTSENEYLEYSNCKSYPIVGQRPIKITLYPKIANKVENVLGGTGFQAIASSKTWLNTVNDQIPVFGIKLFIPSFTLQPEDTPLLQVRVKFDMSFKNSK